MAIQDIRKYFNAFVDGRGYAGKFEEVNPPKITAKMDEFTGGGMFAPAEIIMGMEKLEADVTSRAYDKNLLGSFGVTEGSEITISLREALEDQDGTETGVVHTMRGKVKELDQGTVQPGQAAKLKVSFALTYYKLVHGGTTVLEIDTINMVFKQNGTDKLANIRNLLGI
ncbi:phage major tail tube protein [Caballeronia fortuita]|uniref:Phage major tail tube protein n=1 Tax=Caballeronia fortuita TaxID=1777138 RepID=A0A158E896_9BURK|nr:phage major tail tube protein [Caballeronia fortuita]SAL03092.1 phage major tail tube protein [Caballeronia fortuita]